ncbi:MAG: 50S ribosomal protein L29 [Thermoanaerobaculales bacterium]|nr:50S ribosomal protein L29 [Thermoanaerobaculales bacterium]
MNAGELRDRSVDELKKTLGDLEEQLFKLRFQKSTGQIENPIKIREVRKDIARVLTVMGERRSQEASHE